MERQKISVVHINNDIASYTKGFYDFICNINKSKENINAIKIIQNIFLTGFTCLILYIPHVVGNILIYYRCMPSQEIEIYDNKEPSTYDEKIRNYCIKNHNDIIVKCYIHNINIFAAYIIGAFATFAGCFAIMVICGTLIGLYTNMNMKTYICIKTCIQSFVQSCVDITKYFFTSINRYKIYRNEIKEKIKEDLVEIV